jgi:hypothetical protein
MKRKHLKFIKSFSLGSEIQLWTSLEVPHLMCEILLMVEENHLVGKNEKDY